MKCGFKRVREADRRSVVSVCKCSRARTRYSAFEIRNAIFIFLLLLLLLFVFNQINMMLMIDAQNDESPCLLPSFVLHYIVEIASQFCLQLRISPSLLVPFSLSRFVGRGCRGALANLSTHYSFRTPPKSTKLCRPHFAGTCMRIANSKWRILNNKCNPF